MDGNRMSWCQRRAIRIVPIPVSKIRKNIYMSDIEVILVNFTAISNVFRSFIPNKSPITQYCLYSVDFKARRELWNPLSKAVPGKFHGSGGHSNRKCLQDRANFHRYGAWQIVLSFNTIYILYNTFSLLCYRWSYLLACICTNTVNQQFSWLVAPTLSSQVAS